MQHATDFLHAILSLADRFMVPCFWPGYLSSASTILFCAMLFLAAVFSSSFQVSGRLRVCVCVGFFLQSCPRCRAQASPSLVTMVCMSSRLLWSRSSLLVIFHGQKILWIFLSLAVWNAVSLDMSYPVKHQYSDP